MCDCCGKGPGHGSLSPEEHEKMHQAGIHHHHGEQDHEHTHQPQPKITVIEPQAKKD